MKIYLEFLEFYLEFYEYSCFVMMWIKWSVIFIYSFTTSSRGSDEGYSTHKQARIKSDLEDTFEIKDLGDVHWLLGVKITWDRKSQTVSLSQTSYMDTVIMQFRMQETYPVSTPLEIGVHLSKSMSPKDEKEGQQMLKKPFQAAMG